MGRIFCFFASAMKNLLKTEEILQLVLAMALFQALPISWGWMAALFLAPDLGMLGYVINTRAGAFSYNLLHHKGLAIAVYLLGFYLKHDWLQFTGLLLFAHSAFDRALGYGLKYSDSFQHTHLGYIGSNQHANKQELLTTKN